MTKYLITRRGEFWLAPFINLHFDLEDEGINGRLYRNGSKVVLDTNNSENRISRLKNYGLNIKKR